jgi:hypothetical protein
MSSKSNTRKISKRMIRGCRRISKRMIRGCRRISKRMIRSRKIVSKMRRKKNYKLSKKYKIKKFKGGALESTVESTAVMTSSINSNNKIKVSYTPLGAGGSYGDLYKVTKLSSVNDIEINLPSGGIVFKKLKKTPSLKYDYLIQVIKILELNNNLIDHPYLKGIFCLKDSADSFLGESESLTSMGFLLGKKLPSFMMDWNPLDTTQFNSDNSANSVNDKYCNETSNCFFMKQLKADIVKYDKKYDNVIENKNSNIQNLFTKLIELYNKDLLCLDIKPDNIMYDNDGKLYIIDPDGFFHFNSLSNESGEITYEQLESVPITPNLVSYMPSLYIKLGKDDVRHIKPLRKINIFLSSLYLLMKLLLVNIYYNSDELSLKISLQSPNPPKITIFALVTYIMRSENTLNLNPFEYTELFIKIFTPNSISLKGQPQIKDLGEENIKQLFETIIRLNYDEGILNNNTTEERDTAIISELEGLIASI